MQRVLISMASLWYYNPPSTYYAESLFPKRLTETSLLRALRLRRRVSNRVAQARCDGRRGRQGSYNVGSNKESSKVRREGRIEISEGEGEELSVHSSALGRLWKGEQGKGGQGPQEDGTPPTESRVLDVDEKEDLDSAAFSPAEAARVSQSSSSIGVHWGGAAVGVDDSEYSMELGRLRDHQHSMGMGDNMSQEVVHKSKSAYLTWTADSTSDGVQNNAVDTKEGPPGSVRSSVVDNPVERNTRSDDEPVFLEVIPQDVVTIHPDASQTVGFFDGQQPIASIELKERNEEMELEKEWESWPTELQESQIKIRPDVKGKYGTEMAVAVQAVQLACMLSQRVQERLLRNEEKAGSKKDKSLITVADWGVQAVVSWVLSQAFQGDEVSMVAEEDTKGLRGENGIAMSQRVVNAVNECLYESSVVGIVPPKQPLGSYEVLKFINKGTAFGGSKGRHWVLDPVDGTLGFVRGDQYAVALALVDNGEVVLGVLGCPNFPMRTAWLGYHHKYYRMAMKLAPPNLNTWHRGCVLTAQKGDGQAWMHPMVFNGDTFNRFHPPRKVCVSTVIDPADATFCEPVEKANSSHSFTAGLADTLGLRNEPLRVYSMAKYAAIARGDAEIFMKFAKAGYKEKIWDHAAGVLIVQEAGGVVTDAGGRPLDFSKGRFLEGLDRGIIACCGKTLHKKIISAIDASWNSSTL